MAIGLLLTVGEHTVWLYTLYATAAATLWALPVVLSGCVYDPALNVATGESIVVP